MPVGRMELAGGAGGPPPATPPGGRDGESHTSGRRPWATKATWLGRGWDRARYLWGREVLISKGEGRGGRRKVPQYYT